MIARAKIVQTKGIPKKKLAFLWAFLSAAYLGTIVQSSANERNAKEKARLSLAFLSVAYLGTIAQSSANEGNAKEKARFSLGIPECRLSWDHSPKIVQTKGMAKKKLAFLWVFLSAAPCSGYLWTYTSTACYPDLSNLQGAALVAVRILRADKEFSHAFDIRCLRTATRVSHTFDTLCLRTAPNPT